jgi:hypothetical protein
MYTNPYDSYNNLTDVAFIPKYNWTLNERNIITEAQLNDDLVPGFPINKLLKFTPQMENKLEPLLIKSIQYGMALTISYRGDKDKWRGGRIRTIYPMALGVNANTQNKLLRTFHVEGWSVHKKKEVNDEWRLMKTVNILSIMFTGNFYRMAPAGYRLNDRVMTERIICQADFSTIRRNQQSLLNEGKIEQVVERQDKKLQALNLNRSLDLKKPFEGFEKKDIDKIEITVLKSILTKSENNYIAIVGVRGIKNHRVRVFTKESGGSRELGNYMVVRYLTKSPNNPTFLIETSVQAQDQVERPCTMIDGKAEFPMFKFEGFIR